MSGEKKRKIILLGDSAVGKTALVKKWLHLEYPPAQQSPTYGAGCSENEVWVNGKMESVQVWDTAGQEKFRSLIPSYIRDSTVALFVYDITSEEAAFFAIAEVGLNGIRRTKIELGNRVVVYGAGVIGQLLVRYLLAGGCTEIMVINRSKKRLSYLPKSPAVIPVSPTEESVLEAVKKATYGEMADIVFETTGNADLIPEEFKVLHQQGKLCMLSSPRKATMFDFHDFCNAGSFEIIGAHISSQAPEASFDNPWTCVRNSEVFFKMLYNRQMEVSSLISHRVSYKEAPDMYKKLLEDRSQTMGVIFNWK